MRANGLPAIPTSHAERPASARPRVRRITAPVWLALAGVMLAAPLCRADRMGLLVPAYQYPTLGSLWADCAAAAPRLPLVAVLNPASGPGPSADPTYTAAIGAVRSGGGRVIGYVATFGGDAPRESVLAQVDRYRAQYALDGIFLDIMANDANPAHVAYYAAIRDSIRARRPDWLVVGNPGAQTLPEYGAGADVLCNFESWGRDYFSFVPSAWVASVPPTRFAHLLHTLSTPDSMRTAVRRARTLNAAWVFVTPDTMINPYDATPAYWSALVAEAETTTVAATALTAPAAGVVRPLVASPNPARGVVAFAWRGPAGARVRVMDARGRMVRELPCGPAGATWDGRDGRGARVPPGVYFAAVSGAAGATVRFVRIE